VAACANSSCRRRDVDFAMLSIALIPMKIVVQKIDFSYL
jgi:hypothetical protein